jgi:hypothetical protein
MMDVADGLPNALIFPSFLLPGETVSLHDSSPASASSQNTTPSQNVYYRDRQESSRKSQERTER